jgi:DNA-binding LacI/PurR family transcriptional regulator
VIRRVAGTDLNAIGVMEVLQVAGLRVPEDVAVVGFDDATLAHLADPPLTTLRMRFDEFGRRASAESMPRSPEIPNPPRRR